MASSLLQAVFGTRPFKIVSDRFGYPYWTDLKILGVDILVASSVVEDPLGIEVISYQDEDTFVNLLDVDTSNGKIIQPTKLRVKCLCADLSTVEGLMLGFSDLSATYTITTRGIIADTMMMTDITIVQSGERLSAVELTIEWEQFADPAQSGFDPDNPANQSTYGVRIQSLPETPAASLSRIGSDLTSAAQSLYDRVQNAIF
jgi:hypothetical protein